ncbi:MAG: iron ABC transporter permease [Planctomycetes bacterium]|nr:iron ABC transporter permease [Planctomycetota bacterium]
MRRLVLAISLFVFGAVCLLPVLSLLGMTLRDAEGNWTLAKYGTLFGDDRSATLWWSTLSLAGTATVVATVVGVLVAAYATRVRSRLARALWIPAVAALLIPPYINALTWWWFFDGNGWFNGLLRRWTGTPISAQPPVMFTGWWFAVGVLASCFFPIVTLLAAAGFRAVDPDLEEAARLARGRAAAFAFVTLRLTLPYVVSGAAFVFVFAVSSYSVPDLLRVQTYSSEVYARAVNQADFSAAAAAAIPLVALTLGGVVVYAVVERRRRLSTAGSVRRAGEAPLSPALWPGLALCWLAVFVAAGMPVLNLLNAWSANPDVERSQFATGNEALDRLNVAMTNMGIALREASADIRATLLLAAATATLLTLLGASLGWFSARARGARGAWLENAPLLPLAFPAVTVGVALIQFWNAAPPPPPEGSFWQEPRAHLFAGFAGFQDYVYTSFWIMLLAAATRYLPFTIKPAAAAARAVDVSLEEAARTAGVPWWRRTLAITMRLSANALAAAWVLTFILVVEELDIFLLVKPGIGVLPERIYNAFHFGRTGVVAAWCLALLAFIVSPLALFRILAGARRAGNG